MSGAAQPAAGRRFEYKVRDDLRANGYWVMRSPASKSPVDLVAIKPGQVLFVQCKLNGRMDPAQRAELRALARSAGGLGIMASKEHGELWYSIWAATRWVEFTLDEVGLGADEKDARVGELEQAEMAARDALTERTEQ